MSTEEEAIGTVVGQASADGRVSLAVGSESVEAVAAMFPTGWTLAPGDQVLFNVHRGEAYPLVEMSSGSDGVVFTTMNDSAADERIIARY